MQITAVGLDHTNAPIALREQFAWHGAALDQVLARLGTVVPDGFVLSTCNRTEVYAGTDPGAPTAARLLDLLADCGGVDRASLDGHASVHTQRAAVEHLFAVAGGLRSMVTGEHQILAQLKDALEHARSARVLGATTHRFGTAALAVGKRIRTETAIGQRAPSIVSVAIGEAVSRVGPRAGCDVLIVGAGRIAGAALRHLERRARPDVIRPAIVNRTTARAATIAERHRARLVPWAALGDAIARAQIVISCTSAPHVVIDRALLEWSVRERRGSPLVIVDLAMPRDVDPTAREIDGVTLLDLDHIDAVCREGSASLGTALTTAEHIVTDEASRFMEWLSVRRITPTIAALVSRADAIREAETERALAGLPGLSPQEQATVRTLAARVTGKLLNAPLSVLHVDHGRDELAAALRRLFLLEQSEPVRAARVPSIPRAPRPPACEPHPGAAPDPILLDS